MILEQRNLKLWLFTFEKKLPLGICIELYRLIYINFPDLKQSNLQINGMIIINIDIAITKTNTIISEIKIAYAYNLAQAWYRSQCNEHVQNRYFYLFDNLDITLMLLGFGSKLIWW